MRPEHWKQIAKWSARLFGTVLLLLIAAALVVLVVLPRAVHGQALTVLSGSMTPTLPVGSIVVVRPVDPGTLRAGDIATYQVAPGKAEYITHRITKINTSTAPTSFTFKGDANRGPDPKPVPAGAIRGKVWFDVPYLGAIRDSLHGEGGLALLGMIVLSGYALIQLASAAKDHRKNKVSRRSNGEQITSAHALIVATFDSSVAGVLVSSDSFIPDQFIPLTDDEVRFKVLIARPPKEVDAVVEQLQQQHPLSIDVWSPPTHIHLGPGDRMRIRIADKESGTGNAVDIPTRSQHAKT